MYSGTTFHHKSGNIIGAHQRIDRIAKRMLIHHIGHRQFFPSIKSILHFEGKNGPDGIKSKSPSVDEPWHFISPDAGPDDPLIQLIENHIHNLSIALKNEDEQRAAFEAAWLAHAVVDGLTPAHHYPLAEKIEELWGKPHHERSSRYEKIVIKGKSRTDMMKKNWQYWGANGVFNMHWSFEWGVAYAMTVNSFRSIQVSDAELRRVEKEGFVPLFLEAVKEVDALKMYEEFALTGWSVHLGNTTRRKLIPIISKTVCLGWYAAAQKLHK